MQTKEARGGRGPQPSRPPRPLPSHLYFLVSAVFHYLGPAFAVLLFAHVSVLGVVWLRIGSAAVVLAAWRRPWQRVSLWSPAQRWTVIALGTVLAAMNTTFYFAIASIPLATVGAIEFLGTIILAVMGVRNMRNVAALVLAVAGVWFLTDVQLARSQLGIAFAFTNCGLFMLYIVLGHRIAGDGQNAIDQLGMSMLVAFLAVTPFAVTALAPLLSEPRLLLAGIGVGVCSSVIPYVCDQLAMARLPRATFAMLLALLPASATVIGVIVLQQVPSRLELTGVGLIIAGVGLHQQSSPARRKRPGSLPVVMPKRPGQGA